MKNAIFKFIVKDNTFVVVILRLLSILLLLSISRMSLYFLNPGLFGVLSLNDLLSIYLKGLKFDISILFMLTFLFILANTIPIPLRRDRIYQRIINYVTLCLISLAIFSNLADAIYYRFTMKRMTVDIFNYMAADTGLAEMAPRFLVDYWYVVFITIVAIVGLIFVYSKIRISSKIEKLDWRFYFLNSILFLMSVFFIVVGIRGGIGKKD